uniref:Uncharacterized protein n=1 Tax=Rhizophora mucronata TaxID=61149 RepID=A0A2P2NQL2_RHIMU
MCGHCFAYLSCQFLLVLVVR